MITVLVWLTNEKNIATVRSNLFLCEGEETCLFVGVTDEDLYLEARKGLEAFGERCLVFYANENVYEESKQYINSDLVLLLAEDKLLKGEGLSRLVKDYKIIGSSGFVSGDYEGKECWVNDIYEDLEFRDFEDDDRDYLYEELLGVDVVYPFGVLIGKDKFLEIDFKGDLRFFGLSLRKKGYKNYLDERVKLVDGGVK